MAFVEKAISFYFVLLLQMPILLIDIYIVVDYIITMQNCKVIEVKNRS
jgi:hypothetical protein